VKNENRKILPAMGAVPWRAPCGFRSRRATPGAQSKQSQAGVLWPKEQTASSKKARARFAARAEALLEQRPQTRGVGLLIVDAKAADAVRAERRQVFRPGFEHEAVPPLADSALWPKIVGPSVCERGFNVRRHTFLPSAEIAMW